MREEWKLGNRQGEKVGGGEGGWESRESTETCAGGCG